MTEKFSAFTSGGDVAATDEFVGIDDGTNDNARWAASAMASYVEGTLDDLVPTDTTTLDTSTPGQVGVDVVPEDVTAYSSGSNNYTAPTWATTVEIAVTGPGGAGGSGAIGPTNTIRGGGGGGGHGGVVRATFSVSDLSFPLACVVGTASTGGASVASGTASGNPGTIGTASTVTAASGKLLLSARPGAVGAGGTAAVGGAGGDNTVASQFIGMDGAKGGGDSAATDLTNAGGIGGGGGGGMGMTASGNTISANSNGGFPTTVTSGIAGISNFPGSQGDNGVNWASGGGGGGRNTNGSLAVTGGAGGFPGAGGGGGGSALDGQANGSGAGGAGGGGRIVLIARR